MPVELPRWLRVVLVAILATLGIGAGLFGWRYYTRPVTLTVAAGSFDGESVRLMGAIAGRLTAKNAPVRLKVLDAGTAVEASKAFSAGKAELAVVRGDIGDLSAARTVVVVAYGVVMFLVPSNSSIDSIDKLKNKTVGLVGGDVDTPVVQALDKEYDLSGNRVHFKNLTLDETPNALKSKEVSALLVVAPVSPKYIALIRGLFAKVGKEPPTILSIEAAGAVANAARAYESFDLPKGSLRGSPANPDDDLTTLRVPFYLVANKSVSDDVVTDLTKEIIDARRDLVATNPILAQIAAPSTDKDAFIPIHGGAATYFNGDEQSFFDKYGNALFYGPMLLGGLVSALAWAWKFAGKEEQRPLRPLHVMAGRIREASTDDELAAIEEEIDAILMARLARYGSDDQDARDATALSLLAQRLERLIDRRRGAFVPQTTAPSS
jgi:TRAP-type uncharacterized transport system substrate-binding protein